MLLNFYDRDTGKGLSNVQGVAPAQPWKVSGIRLQSRGVEVRECQLVSMTPNREILERLWECGGIRVRRGELFSEAPGGMPTGFDFPRVEGMLLGLAVGDALGNPSESTTPSSRAQCYGEIRDYRDGKGGPSDDTQLAFWTLEQMLADGGFNPAHVARRFTQGRIFGIGSSVKQFLKNCKSGKPWEECGVHSAGNGALMRIAPVLVPHLRSATTDVWVDTALCAMLTHNDSASIAACLAFIRLLWKLLQRDSTPEPEWWLENMVSPLRDLECKDSYEPRSPTLRGFRGALWQLLEQAVMSAHRNRLSTAEACNQWHSGAYLLETVPSAIYILMRHGHDPEEAIIRAVNDTWDNDTVAAIVGAAVGALHGRHGLPERWIRGLSGRTKEGDEGRIFELLKQARQQWWD